MVQQYMILRTLIRN